MEEVKRAATHKGNRPNTATKEKILKNTITGIILLLAVNVTGCATMPMSAREATPVPNDELYAFQVKENNDAAQLTVIRDSGVLGAGCDFVFYIEGKKAAKFGPGQMATFYVSPGNVNLGIGLAESGLCFGVAIQTISSTIKPNQDNQFRISSDMQNFYLAPYVDYGGR